MGSNPSLYSPHGSEENIKSDRAIEDLYQWMAKQEPMKMVKYISGTYYIDAMHILYMNNTLQKIGGLKSIAQS